MTPFRSSSLRTLWGRLASIPYEAPDLPKDLRVYELTGQEIAALLPVGVAFGVESRHAVKLDFDLERRMVKAGTLGDLPDLGENAFA